ncbi:MAG: 30S ribosomal protein S14 [Candidatus Micrarchaeota archaeon]|nr:30S ribosomal protein S14 [Candidatus Micrarchaeota archaeon]
MADKDKKKSRKIPPEHKYQGKGLRKCRFCGSARALIRSYGLRICRRCFREVAEEIGFRKY